jgi:hypothetical protein
MAQKARHAAVLLVLAAAGALASIPVAALGADPYGYGYQYCTVTTQYQGCPTTTTTTPTTTVEEKTTICHHTGSKSNPYVTITISSNAVDAHSKHGDTLGPCPPG